MHVCDPSRLHFSVVVFAFFFSASGVLSYPTTYKAQVTLIHSSSSKSVGTHHGIFSIVKVVESFAMDLPIVALRSIAETHMLLLSALSYRALLCMNFMTSHPPKESLY